MTDGRHDRSAAMFQPGPAAISILPTMRQLSASKIKMLNTSFWANAVGNSPTLHHAAPSSRYFVQTSFDLLS